MKTNEAWRELRDTLQIKHGYMSLSPYVSNKLKASAYDEILQLMNRLEEKFE